MLDSSGSSDAGNCTNTDCLLLAGQYAHDYVDSQDSGGSIVIGLVSAAKSAAHAAGVGLHVVSTIAHEATPYFAACVEGGAIGAIDGPVGAGLGCAAQAFAEYATKSNNPTVKKVAFSFQVIAAVDTGYGVWRAEANPARPFELWSEFLGKLGD